MSGRIAVTLTLSQLIENVLQFACARDDDARVYGPEFEKLPEVIQVTIEKWILVVPLNLKGDFALNAINLARISQTS